MQTHAILYHPYGQDVVRGEILPAYVERVRDQDGRIDVSLRAYGFQGKATDARQQILDALQLASGGELAVGDKSTPKDIVAVFPGMSKSTFKKAVGVLYREGLVQPGPQSIRLMPQPSSSDSPET